MNTTYQNTYTPQKAEKVLVVRNPENLGNIPARMKGMSNYRTSYGWNDGKTPSVEKAIRPQDNLGLRSSSVGFLGRTSYGSDYKKYPNIQSPGRTNSGDKNHPSIGPMGTSKSNFI